MRLPAASRFSRATVRGALTVALVAFALAGVIAVIALADHHRTKAQSGDANQAIRFCQFKGTHCDDLQIKDLEGGWHHRELGYRISFFSLSSGGDRRSDRRLRARVGSQALGPQQPFGSEPRLLLDDDVELHPMSLRVSSSASSGITCGTSWRS